jgi:hypothetical protein
MLVPKPGPTISLLVTRLYIVLHKSSIIIKKIKSFKFDNKVDSTINYVVR